MPAESWLHTGKQIPAGGVTVDVHYRKGNNSSRLHLPAIAPVITRALGCRELFPGSLNLHAGAAMEFPSPTNVRCDDGHDWLFVPVVISETAVGVAARCPPPERTEFIEVFACDQIAATLGITYGDQLTIRVLPGSHLGLAP